MASWGKAEFRISFWASYTFHMSTKAMKYSPSRNKSVPTFHSTKPDWTLHLTPLVRKPSPQLSQPLHQLCFLCSTNLTFKMWLSPFNLWNKFIKSHISLILTAGIREVQGSLFARKGPNMMTRLLDSKEMAQSQPAVVLQSHVKQELCNRKQGWQCR